MRENLIKQAVTFLTNPGLKSTSVEKKKEFLKGKGVTDEEFDEAVKRVDENEKAPSAAPAATASTSASTAAPTARSPMSLVNRGPPASAVPAATVVQRRHNVGAERGLSHRRAPSAASSGQATLLLRRRLAELEHERACYLEAIAALGDDVPEDETSVEHLPAAVPAAPPSAPPVTAAPAQASSVAKAPAVAVSASPTATSPTASSSGVAPTKKPWEGSSSGAGVPGTGGTEGAGSASSGSGAVGGTLRDDDPDLVDIVPPPKAKI